MSQREIVVWVDERWCKALEQYLLDGSIAEKLEEHIDELVNKLPESVYERISSEIWQEREQARMDAEAARRFAVLHVTESGNSTYFVAEENLDMLHVAARLRSYTRKPPENSPARLTGMFSKGEKISREQFDAYIMERLEKPGRVVGAYEIDLDKGRFDSLHTTDGWQCFRIQDVSTATYYAMKKSHTAWGERESIFHSRLDGKQLTNEDRSIYLTGARTLRTEDISFAEDIVQNENLLEFYIQVCFDADKVFGTHVCTTENDDYLNVYANYDMDKQQVADTLEVYLVRGTGGEQDYKYRLTDEEKELLLPRMEEYCQQKWGQSLDKCCQQYLSEQQQEQQSSEMTLS